MHKSKVCCKAEPGLPHPSSSHNGSLGSALDSPVPLLLGWAELGCDSPSTHMAAPHTSTHLTHGSLCLAGAWLSPCHSLPPFSHWLGLPASISSQLRSLVSSEHLPHLVKGTGSRLEETGDCGTAGTCLSYLPLALLGQGYFSGQGIL